MISPPPAPPLKERGEGAGYLKIEIDIKEIK
jgi:hypothetical protein